jgi:hypothetical protein
MQNPWGLTVRGTSPFWIANNGTGLATLYNTSSGAAVKQGLVVTVPGETVGTTAPITGTVGNLSSSFNGDLFLFSAENGGIYGWRGGPWAPPRRLSCRPFRAASTRDLPSTAAHSMRQTSGAGRSMSSRVASPHRSTWRIPIFPQASDPSAYNS